MLNTAVEVQACGTPVAAFDAGGLPDIVAHRETGWLSKPFDIIDLAEEVMWLLADDARQRVLAEAARRQAIEFLSNR